jgi:putative transposase
MVFKLVMSAAKTLARLKGENQLPEVVQGVTFRNGVEVSNTQHRTPPDHHVTQIPT